MDREKMVKILGMIAADMEKDAKDFDGKVIAMYFGHQGAAIAALANIIKAMLEEQMPVDPEIEKINNMTQMEMARLQRFAPSGHKYFDSSKPYFEIFSERFKELGGFTPAISKEIGW